MAVPIYAPEPSAGFLGIFEGAALGIAAGWWLQMHYQPPAMFVGAGIGVTAAYAAFVSCCRRVSLMFPILLVSVALWATLGWVLGGYAFNWLGDPLIRMKLFATAAAWKATGAVAMGILAFTEKGARMQ